MKKSAPPAPARPAKIESDGFRVSAQPVVPSRPVEKEEPAENPADLGELPALADGNVFYAIARDPKSLFLYWEIDWAPLLAGAGLNSPAVQLRILREDESEEAISAIDPARGFCFVDVAAAEAIYFCELGYFAEGKWSSLIRSNAATTPASAMSEDREAEFATLPFHLSFQRLIEIFRTPSTQRDALANSIAEVQAQARVLQQSMTPADWAKLVEAAAVFIESETKSDEEKSISSTELSALLPIEPSAENQTFPTADLHERWRDFEECFGGSSWGGGSSPA